METIGIGVVGCGFVGRGAHVPAFSAIEGANLVAVADPDRSRLSKVKKKHDLESAYEDFAELIEDPNVHAVVVSVPTPLHTRVAMAAIEAGKHVLCEMPLAATLDEVDTMIAAAKSQGVILMPGLNFRFTPTFTKMKEMIDRGEIGRPVSAQYREFIPAADLAGQWPTGAWVWDLEQSGGPLFTLAVWSIDLLRWMFDTEIAEIHAETKYTKLEKHGGSLGYDSSVCARLESGLVSSLQYSGSVARSASACSLEVLGDSTSLITTSDNDLVTLLGDDPIKTEWNVKQPGAGMWGHLQQDEHFVQCIREGCTPITSPEDGRIATQIAIQIAKSTTG
ncbi:MAG: Gfo/Idh/MocA family oxidoreductase [Pirellulaceae bacterium]|jgi:predicted dehydrogenase|nr:Gfo/Idh/MocA family oxidoreductase [Pirellulaceae bacterium]HJN66008.1 Gfo/Idh/MocA family oxidoreductase [Pirellulales bacterium]